MFVGHDAANPVKTAERAECKFVENHTEISFKSYKTKLLRQRLLGAATATHRGGTNTMIVYVLIFADETQIRHTNLKSRSIYLIRSEPDQKLWQILLL